VSELGGSVENVRHAGSGTELWRVRVDLFAEEGDGHRVQACADALSTLLSDGTGEEGSSLGVDQGVGDEGRPVVGLLFWVMADDVGGAASTAVEVARLAGKGNGVGPGLYDVTVIPSDAVVAPGDALYPAMPD